MESIEWETPEYIHHEKGRDWFLVVIIISIGIIAAEILAGNFLVIVLTIIAITTFLLVAIRKPRIVPVRINASGVRIDAIFYTYAGLKQFSVVEGIAVHKLILQSTKALSPYIIIPLGPGVEPDQVRELLKQHIDEIELHEPVSHLLLERLGF
jgi:hypothetical protein